MNLNEEYEKLLARVELLERDSHPAVALPIDRIEAKLNELLARAMPAGAAARRLHADEDPGQRDQAAQLRELTSEESTKHLTCPKCTEIMGLMCPGCGHQPEESTKPIPTGCPHCGDRYCSSQAPGPFDWAPCPQAPKEPTE